LFILFSPGLSAEGFFGLGVLAVALLTDWLLILVATRRKAYWWLVVIQTLLLVVLLIHSLLDSPFYVGT